VIESVVQSAGFQDLRSHPQFLPAVDVFLANEKQFASEEVGRNDRLHDSDRYLPTTFSEGDDRLACRYPVTIEGSTFLWYPWSFAASKTLSSDAQLSSEQRNIAARINSRLLARLSESAALAIKELNYVSAEFLVCVL
jgi:hypothetical protein